MQVSSLHPHPTVIHRRQATLPNTQFIHYLLRMHIMTPLNDIPLHRNTYSKHAEFVWRHGQAEMWQGFFSD